MSVIVTTRIPKEITSGCHHVLADKSMAFYATQERDSFGNLSEPHCICRKCKKELGEGMCDEPCSVCGQYKSNNDMRGYRWHGFDSMCGDIPDKVCVTCWDTPYHQSRLEKDRAKDEWEFVDDDY